MSTNTRGWFTGGWKRAGVGLLGAAVLLLVPALAVPLFGPWALGQASDAAAQPADSPDQFLLFDVPAAERPGKVAYGQRANAGQLETFLSNWTYTDGGSSSNNGF
jgi:hypothetical protein